MTPMTTYQKMAAILLFLTAIFFGFFQLKESPPFNFDEGWYIQSASNLLTSGIDGLQLAPGYIEHLSTYVSVGYPLIYSLALWFKIFGIGILEARLLMVTLLFCFTGLGFLLARQLYGNKIALFALALIVTFPPLYGNGKAVMGEMPGLFFLAVSLFAYSLARSNPSRKTLWLVICGLSAGLFVATKAAFILLIPALMVAAFIEWRRGSLSLKDIGIAILSVLVPLIIWLILKFQPGDSLSEVLRFYANPSRVSDMTTIIIQNVRTLFSDVGPLYTMGLMFVWFVSLIIRLRSRTKLSFEEVAAFIFAVLTVVSFTRTAGFYRYLFPAQIVALIFFPYALQVFFESISKKIGLIRGRPIYEICISFLLILGLYQLGFSSYVADSYGSRKLHDMQEYFDAIPDSTSVFFYNSTGLVPLFKGKEYYQYLILFNQADWTVGAEWLPVMRAGEVDLVVAGPRSEIDEKNGVFEPYIEVKKFDKITILKRR